MDKSMLLFSIVLIVVSCVGSVVFVYWVLKRRKRSQKKIDVETVDTQSSEKKSKNVVFVIFMLIFIVVFEAVGIGILYSAYAKKKACSVITDGVIIECRGRQYRPIVEYQVGNEKMIGNSNLQTNIRPFKIGAHVRVGYNPSKPSQFYIEGYELNALYRLGGVFMVVGTTNGLLAIICIILRKIKMDEKRKNFIEGKIIVADIIIVIVIVWILLMGWIMTLVIFSLLGLFVLYGKHKNKKQKYK